MSFGQNIIDQGEIQPGLFGDAFVGTHKHNVDAVPNCIFGITDDFSLYVEGLDYAVSYRDGINRSRGWEDTLFQLEYAFYNEESKTYIDQGTFLFGLYLPSGSGTKIPNTGFGSPAIFVGSTYSRTGIYCYWFTSYGANFTFSQNGNKIGNQYLYQGGFGRYITTFSSNWLFCWLVEVDGFYFERNKIRGVIDPNSGGTAIYVTPSIWLANCDWRFQLGLGYAVQQHLFGRQNRLGWLYVFDIVYSIW